MSASLPTGTVTFVFTDIEGSTKLLQELGDGYAEVSREHRRIVREAFGERDGTEIDTQGDSFFFSFPRARGPHLRRGSRRPDPPLGDDPSARRQRPT
jgi:class 3 adenylate cyclase